MLRFNTLKRANCISFFAFLMGHKVYGFNTLKRANCIKTNSNNYKNKNSFNTLKRANCIVLGWLPVC